MSGTYEYQAAGDTGKSPAVSAPLFVHVNGGQCSMPARCLSEPEEDGPVWQRRDLVAVIVLSQTVQKHFMKNIPQHASTAEETAHRPLSGPSGFAFHLSSSFCLFC